MERYKSREQLDALLAKLKTDLPAMVRACDGIANFGACVFEGEADDKPEAVA